jgi:hypothetical protein
MVEMFGFGMETTRKELLRMVLETLIEARNFPKHSYVATFLGMRNKPNPNVSRLETHQATLELFTERSSQRVETNLHPLYLVHSEQYVRNHFSRLLIAERLKTSYILILLLLLLVLASLARSNPIVT